MGNDINDSEAMKNVGYSIVPADAYIACRDKKAK